MSVVSLGTLNRNSEDGFSLLLISDDLIVVRHLQNAFTSVDIRLTVKSASESQNYQSSARNCDLLIYHLTSTAGGDVKLAVQKLRQLYPDLKIYVIDSDASPERAVDAMKAGADDYSAHKGEPSSIVQLVEKSCIDSRQGNPAVARYSARLKNAPPVLSLNNKVHDLAKTTSYLANCKNLQELCEGLLISVGEALGATGGSLYLNEGNSLRRVHSLDPGHAPNLIELPLRKGSIFEQVYTTGEAVLLTGEEEIRHHKVSGWSGYEANNLFVYPLMQKNGEPIGIMSLHGKCDQEFTQEDKDLVLILASYSHETIRALLAHEKAKRSLDSLRLTFQNMNQGIIHLNESGEIVDCNPKILSILQMNDDTIIIGLTVSDIFEVMKQRADMDEVIAVESFWDLFDEDLEYVFHCCSGVVIKITANEIEQGGHVLTFTDITKQKEWEDQLFEAKEKAEAASHSKTNFLANVSHELRTPLNAIIGFAEMIDKEVYGPLNNERYSGYVGHIHESGAHLLRLINNLLDLSKVEAGKFVREDGDVHLSGLIKNTMMYFSGQASDNRINLTLEENASLGIIQADENALRQILLNLLSNALKFTPKGGDVKVTTALTDGGDLQITVQDTGIGIEEKSIQTALQPFGQVENAFNRKYPGTGLGLPLVVSLTELHNGQFDIQSALGDGTICRVLIPVVH